MIIIHHNLGDNMCWTSISDIIEDVMDVGFDVVLEDASADDLSKHICKLYCDWNQSMEGRTKVIDELTSLPTLIPIQIVPVKPTREKQKVTFVFYVLLFIELKIYLKVISNLLK